MRRNVQVPKKIDPHTLSRFLAEIVIDPETGCWLIPGRENLYNCRSFWPLGPVLRAHRYIYETFMGPIPLGFVLDHLCRRPGCVNPLHLEPVTVQLNSQRAKAGDKNARKTHCVRGHPLAGNNLYLIHYASGATARRCRTCNNLAARRYYQSRKRLRESQTGPETIGGIDNYEPLQRPAPDVEPTLEPEVNP